MVNQLREMLSKVEWSYFATFTSEEILNERKTYYLMDKFYEDIKKFDGEIFWIGEPNNDRKGYHVHALIKVNKCHPILTINGRLEFEKIWSRNLETYIGSKRARCIIKDYDSNLGGIIYITKLMRNTERIIYDIQGIKK